MTAWKQKRAFLFSHPRTASNLLTRILSAQPEWDVADYFFFDAFQYTRDAFDGKSIEDVSPGSWKEHESLLKEGHERLEGFLEKSDDTQRHVFLKDHAHLVTPAQTCYWHIEPTSIPAIQTANNRSTPAIHSSSNPTMLSDDMMLSWVPIVLIRNPILVYESWLRAEGEPYPDLNSQYSNIYTTLRFQRAVVDWYTSQDSSSPVIVLDADDVIERREVMEKLCELVGMDKDRLLYVWQATSTPAKFLSNVRFKRFLQTISDSTGVMPGKTSSGITLESREKKWIEEFGADRAAILRERVAESWPDYQYLRSMRLL